MARKEDIIEEAIVEKTTDITEKKEDITEAEAEVEAEVEAEAMDIDIIALQRTASSKSMLFMMVVFEESWITAFLSNCVMCIPAQKVSATSATSAKAVFAIQTKLSNWTNLSKSRLPK